eukprot:COSAG01_NODE_8281_length_2845_cov_14.996723_2_plen_124_part_00
MYYYVLTSQHVPPAHISAGILSCPRNYSSACSEQHSSGSQLGRLDAAPARRRTHLPPSHGRAGSGSLARGTVAGCSALVFQRAAKVPPAEPRRSGVTGCDTYLPPLRRISPLIITSLISTNFT